MRLDKRDLVHLAKVELSLILCIGAIAMMFTVATGVV